MVIIGILGAGGWWQDYGVQKERLARLEDRFDKQIGDNSTKFVARDIWDMQLQALRGDISLLRDEIHEQKRGSK